MSEHQDLPGLLVGGYLVKEVLIALAVNNEGHAGSGLDVGTGLTRHDTTRLTGLHFAFLLLKSKPGLHVLK